MSLPGKTPAHLVQSRQGQVNQYGAVAGLEEAEENIHVPGRRWLDPMFVQR